MAEADASISRRLEIRKYPNRRYYDKTRSRHVTLEEIYALIREGHEVEVIDSKSRQDITAKVLAQIIIELDPPKLGVFPVALLHRLLRSNELIVTDFVQKYFSQPLMSFLDSQRNFEQSLRNAIGLQSPAPTVADWTKMMWGSFNPTLWANRPNAEAGPARPAEPGDDAKELWRMVEDLSRKLDQLDPATKDAPPAPKPTPKKPRKTRRPPTSPGH